MFWRNVELECGAIFKVRLTIESFGCFFAKCNLFGVRMLRNLI